MLGLALYCSELSYFLILQSLFDLPLILIVLSIIYATSVPRFVSESHLLFEFQTYSFK